MINYSPNYKYISIGIIITSIITVKVIEYLNEKETFDKINKNYKSLDAASNILINQLYIYPDNMSRSYTSKKRKKVLLLISGFRDTPKMWIKLENFLQSNNIDYVIPRINGFGRSKFQFNTYWQDWVLSIMEEVSILQNMYDEINILGFSTGCNIALYISQFNWNCKINNLILTAPNLVVNKGDSIYKSILSSTILSNLVLLFYPICHRPYESRVEKKNDNKKSNLKYNIFYEKYFPVYSAIEMWKLQDILPKKFMGKYITIIKANNDRVIGDINEQNKFLQDLYHININIKCVPSSDKLGFKVGHNIFNSHHLIISDFYDQIKNLI